MARCLKRFLYIRKLSYIIIHLSPSMNRLEITLKVMFKQKASHFILESLS